LTSRVDRNVTNRTETPSESLITVSLPPKLHSEVVAFQHRSGISTLSVRVALQALPSNPTTIQKKDTPMAKKKAAAKKSAKKATKSKKK